MTRAATFERLQPAGDRVLAAHVCGSYSVTLGDVVANRLMQVRRFGRKVTTQAAPQASGEFASAPVAFRALVDRNEQPSDLLVLDGQFAGDRATTHGGTSLPPIRHGVIPRTGMGTAAVVAFTRRKHSPPWLQE